jgi:hypothetical protein
LPREEDYPWERFRLTANGVGRIILGAALTRALTLSPNPAQAQGGCRASPCGDETLVQGWMGKRYAKSFGVSGTPATKVIPQGDGRFLTPSLAPLRPFDRLPRFTSPLNIVSPPSAPLSIRSEPDNLRDRSLTRARHFSVHPETPPNSPRGERGTLRTGCRLGAFPDENQTDYPGRLTLPGPRGGDSSLATSIRILTSPTDELLDIILTVSNLIDLGGISWTGLAAQSW